MGTRAQQALAAINLEQTKRDAFVLYVKLSGDRSIVVRTSSVP